MISTSQHAQPAGDRLLRFGAALTVVGMLLTLGAMSPAVFGGALSSIWWALSMLTGLGLVFLLAGLRRASSARSRAARQLRHDSQGAK